MRNNAMTLTDQHIRALTFLACEARPVGARQWSEGDVFAAIAKVRDRSLAAVVCAVARAAADRSAERPSIIPSAGSHWGDTVMAAAFVPNVVASTERCSICSEAKDKCRRVWTDDHDFESSAVAAKRKAENDPEALTNAIAALKAEVAETPAREPNQGRTLEDLADRDPKLRARVDALRDALPAPPPMREPEPAQPDPIEARHPRPLLQEPEPEEAS
jgi:hypothetical protein